MLLFLKILEYAQISLSIHMKFKHTSHLLLSLRLIVIARWKVEIAPRNVISQLQEKIVFELEFDSPCHCSPSSQSEDGEVERDQAKRVKTFFVRM